MKHEAYVAHPTEGRAAARVCSCDPGLLRERGIQLLMHEHGHELMSAGMNELYTHRHDRERMGLCEQSRSFS